MAVRMELSRILIRELNDMQLIELREVAPEGADQSDVRSFPIVIGLPEATAIERRLKGIQIKRPQTHDLLANVIGNMGGELVSITINDLSDHTFFATLDVKSGDGQMLHIDSRPSDAIALGVAEGVPIYVEEHVLEAASKDPELESLDDDSSEEDDE
ncbi:MAG: bifunctional nuclease family protein [Phycisphaeraceae bacterium]|nr:bifunctional nuclease family protein [Phycisphaeraceae bacterium]